MMPEVLVRLGSPPYFYRLAGRWLPWLWGFAAVLLAAGLYGALITSPPDYQQGESVRIIYIHVPSAWLSLSVYTAMAVFSASGLIWRVKVAEAMAAAAAPIGASFTALALITGSLWGRPMWGAWWVWDARLTSELLLLFLYLGVIALRGAFDDRRRGARAAGLLAIVGVVNVPIIHFSVLWWNTLHQGPTITRLDAPAIHPSMLWPLLTMVVAFTLYGMAVGLMRTRAELLAGAVGARWAKRLVRQTHQAQEVT